MPDVRDFTTHTKHRAEEARSDGVKAVTTASSFSSLDSSKSIVIISGSTVAVSVHGIAAGVDGQRLLVVNRGSGNLTFEAQSTVASAVDRIITMTGSDVVTTGNGAGELIYSSTDQRWLLVLSQA